MAACSKAFPASFSPAHTRNYHKDKKDSRAQRSSIFWLKIGRTNRKKLNKKNKFFILFLSLTMYMPQPKPILFFLSFFE
jgi:hypothetical protein